MLHNKIILEIQINRLNNHPSCLVLHSYNNTDYKCNRLGYMEHKYILCHFLDIDIRL